MGKGKSLYVPQQLITKIEQRGGAARLKQCIEGSKAPQSRDFTRTWAKAISERQQTWPSQTAVKDGTAPKQLLEEWEEGKRLAKVSSPPPGRSPPTSPRPRKENRSQPKAEAPDRTARKGGVDYKAALEKEKEKAQVPDQGQTTIQKYLSPKTKPSAEDEKRQREVARVMEPIMDKIKKEMELGAQGYHVEDAGAPERGEETESDEERRLQRLKRKPSGTQGQGQGKESEKVLVPTLKRQRGRIAQDGRLLPKGTTATDAHGRMLEETEEMVQRRLEKAKRILDYIRQHPDHYPPVERHKNGRPVLLDENDAYAQGLKVALAPDPKERRAQYAYLVFVELDLVVNSELGPLLINAIASGRLFMPSDFVPAFGPKKGKPMDGLIIEEVQNMALGGEVKEFRWQRNRAMLANWGELKVKSEQDKLRTMTWADWGSGTTSNHSGRSPFSVTSHCRARPRISISTRPISALTRCWSTWMYGRPSARLRSPPFTTIATSREGTR
jgi:hypothetical protein